MAPDAGKVSQGSSDTEEAQAIVSGTPPQLADGGAASLASLARTANEMVVNAPADKFRQSGNAHLLTLLRQDMSAITRISAILLLFTVDLIHSLPGCYWTAEQIISHANPESPPSPSLPHEALTAPANPTILFQLHVRSN